MTLKAKYIPAWWPSDDLGDQDARFQGLYVYFHILGSLVDVLSSPLCLSPSFRASLSRLVTEAPIMIQAALTPSSVPSREHDLELLTSPF